MLIVRFCLCCLWRALRAGFASHCRFRLHIFYLKIPGSIQKHSWSQKQKTATIEKKRSRKWKDRQNLLVAVASKIKFSCLHSCAATVWSSCFFPFAPSRCYSTKFISFWNLLNLSFNLFYLYISICAARFFVAISFGFILTFTYTGQQ